MSLRTWLLLFAGIICAVSLATPGFGESTDCQAPVVIVPDGRLTASSIPGSTTFWFGIFAQANHSYSVEFVPPADNYANISRPQFTSPVVYAPNDVLSACRGTSSVAVTPNSGYAPTILKNGTGAGRRVSFTASLSGLYLISLTNIMGAGAYTFQAVDTTLVNLRWNTMSGYDIQWIVTNISDMPITGAIIVLDMSGQVVANIPVTIPSSGRITRSSSVNDVSLPRNLAGSALFAHNGPPSSVFAEAFMTNGVTTMPDKFEAIAHK